MINLQILIRYSENVHAEGVPLSWGVLASETKIMSACFLFLSCVCLKQGKTTESVKIGRREESNDWVGRVKVQEWEAWCAITCIVSRTEEWVVFGKW